jgi:hypothetical protein
MVNEFFKSFNIPHTCDEIFNVVYLCENKWEYINYVKYNEVEGFDNSPDSLNPSLLYEDVKSGKVSKPDWFKTVENSIKDSGGGSSYIYISAKEPQYERLAKDIRNFLYSWNAEEGEC